MDSYGTSNVGIWGYGCKEIENTYLMVEVNENVEYGVYGISRFLSKKDS